jgi:hypothetical protein
MPAGVPSGAGRRGPAARGRLPLKMWMPRAGRSRGDESRCHTGYTGHFSLIGIYLRLSPAGCRLSAYLPLRSRRPAGSQLIDWADDAPELTDAQLRDRPLMQRSPRPAGSNSLRRLTDEADITSDEKGSQRPRKELESPSSPGHCLTTATGVVKRLPSLISPGGSRPSWTMWRICVVQWTRWRCWPRGVPKPRYRVS